MVMMMMIMMDENKYLTLKRVGKVVLGSAKGQVKIRVSGFIFSKPDSIGTNLWFDYQPFR